MVSSRLSSVRQSTTGARVILAISALERSNRVTTMNRLPRLSR